MDDWSEIRRRVLVEGVSRRQILRERKMHWRTLKKILEHSEPPGYRQEKRRVKRKLGEYLVRIEQILKEDQAMPRKQRHTAKRIWERLRAEGFTGGYTVVKEAVRGLTQKNQEVFVPLAHPPGEAQVDFLPLPATPFAACRKVSTTANSLSLVRFDCNDYSVPVRWAHHPVVVHGFCQEVVIYSQGEEIARHNRLWSREDVCFEPLHYLALLEKKPGALDHARPLAGWTLPDCFGALRRRLENEREGEGTREYIRILRLLEKHPLAQLRLGVEKGLSAGAITRDAIAQFLYPREDWGLTTFSLDGHPHLRHVRVAAPNLTLYGQLVGGAA